LKAFTIATGKDAFHPRPKFPAKNEIRMERVPAVATSMFFSQMSALICSRA
jgi:hypothetical protein